MPLNLSGLINQFNNTQKTNVKSAKNSQSTHSANQSHAASSASVTENTATSNSAGLQMLKDMLAGETFTGKVNGMQDGNVILQLPDGKELLAKLLGDTALQAGQSLTFMVEQNNGSFISIKPLMQNEQQAVLINKALDAAGFPATDTNINIVKELLNLNMAINTETLMDMVKNVSKYPDANINTIANLQRLNIPVTPENITQFEAYKNYEHSVLGQLKSIGSDINQMFTQLGNDTFIHNEKAATADTLQSFVNILYGTDNAENAELPSQSVNSVLNEDQLNNLKNMLSELSEGEGANILKSLNNNELTVKSLMDSLTSLIKDNPAVGNNLSKLLNSKEFTTLVNSMINETLKISPSEIAKEDTIKDYYKQVREIIDKAENISANDENSPLMKDMQSLKSNIDFMNDLNRNMTYFQMPIKFSESDSNGELYVFTNKRALAAGSDNVSALLHLDMDNLGPIDIYVRLAGKNVSTNFCLESEELLDFVYANIDKLNKRLEELGYSTKFEMKLADDTAKFDFVNNFVENRPATATIPVSQQYVFDTKA